MDKNEKKELVINSRTTTTTVTQTANQVLGTKERTLYYLIFETDKGKLVINVGEKTHNKVKELLGEEITQKFVAEVKEFEVKESLKTDKPKGGK